MPRQHFPRQVFDLSRRPLNGSQVTRVMGFISVDFQLPTPFSFQCNIRHGTYIHTYRQTDRQTDNGPQCIMPSPYGGEA